MLMITVETERGVVTFRLHGRLAGAGVNELARHWSATARSRSHERISLDLTGVSSVDSLGKQFLAQAHRHGDRLVGGVTTKALVDEIASDLHHDFAASSDASGNQRTM